MNDLATPALRPPVSVKMHERARSRRSRPSASPRGSTNSAPTPSSRRCRAARSGKAATLTIMCGGEPAVFERVRPLLERMGKNITLVGGNGDGQTTKVANRIIVALNIAAASEALVSASKVGADPAKVRQALMGGFASSRILEVHGERMVKRIFDPGFRIKLHQKDLGPALQGAREIGVALPQTAGVAQLMQVCAAHGLGETRPFGARGGARIDGGSSGGIGMTSLQSTHASEARP